MTASFRGRPLNGKTVQVPAGYAGVVLRESRRPFTDAEDVKELSISDKFDKFSFWNLDKKCSDDDSFSRAMQWIHVAKAVSHVCLC
ncbi:hypothetical protein CAPTEDRAFT_135490 [Capitella teleta]|uniref:Uncharacterized protein n=1 Tax=Capitella teleta TaxID=283909 RepID=R7V9M8_CAPTE|nr:hypothetical protein CAPTEDRAFT_135490 [Capitella teleta]|eukprot:ELU15177.1 hypothetical protein CAPTEDRAFT_135490 [Capitella teleta]